ncbi:MULTISPECIES: nucleoside triphosphate pyrophosphohydrolase [Bacillaceae]|uniref:Nucleoside triphosphate pyrophosphohydrolase n=1 Tax=Alkalicoccobacillus plakortidis TaxID=444060 RepID=A0A9D5DQP2_9BACI|nr:MULTISPECIES: nucleoside triphosphate pyrophosphohydrolase [Bacillaceae]KQL51639.1 hypothetical protein AN965_19650 [Alkalicoccobacillus plakortidis]
MGIIKVVGLGAGELDQMPLGVYRTLKEAPTVRVRTLDHPVVKDLQHEGVTFESYDETYEQFDSFEAVYETIVNDLIDRAQVEDLVYAVPGHPFVAEKTVQLLQDATDHHQVKLDVVGGTSFLDQMYSSLRIDPIEGCQILDGTVLKQEEIQMRHHLIIVQVYDSLIASDVKLTLMETYPDDYEVTICTAAGTAEEKLTRVPLYELDHQTEVNNLTAVYVPPVHNEKLLYGDIQYLKSVIAQLRSPEGCPWDRKQTHQSLKRFLLEESYEVLEAIDQEDDEQLTEELGDVLLQVLLHAQIGEEAGYFQLGDVIKTLTEKMIRRHPHVFGDKPVQSAEEVTSVWEEVKRKEKAESEALQPKRSISSFPSMLAAAETMQKDIAKTGFEYEAIEQVYDKVLEELNEVRTADASELEKEYGDLLLAVVSLGRFIRQSPEVALHKALTVFLTRFEYVEAQAEKANMTIDHVNMTTLDAWWEEAKRLER